MQTSAFQDYIEAFAVRGEKRILGSNVGRDLALSVQSCTSFTTDHGGRVRDSGGRVREVETN